MVPLLANEQQPWLFFPRDALKDREESVGREMASEAARCAWHGHLWWLFLLFKSDPAAFQQSLDHCEMASFGGPADGKVVVCRRIDSSAVF